MNFLCFTSGALEKHCFPFKNVFTAPLPTQHYVENQKKLQVVVFNIVWGVGGKVRQVKYLGLVCVQKHQKCVFVPRLLSMIVA